VGMDPLTYIPLVSTGGGRLANIGRTRVANATSRTGVVGGRSIVILGRVIQRGSQALDEATSFGAGILLDRVAMPIGRRVGNVIGLGRESNVSRQATEASDAASTEAGIITRADGTAPPLTGTAADTHSVDGGTPTETAAARTGANVEPQAGATSSLPDTRTPDGGDPFDATARDRKSTRLN